MIIYSIPISYSLEKLPKDYEKVLKKEILKLIHLRAVAKVYKDFKLADELREELKKKDYDIDDVKEGEFLIWKKIKIK